VFRWRERELGEGFRYGVDWSVTDRWGGASLGTYGEFNLGAHVGDVPEAVETNRHRLARALGIPGSGLRFMNQQHSCAVARVNGENDGPPDADGMFTSDTEVALVVLVADCTPILLLDRVAGLVAAVHAGRNGMLQGVVPATVERLRVLGSGELDAVVGPSICPRCYEVPAGFRDQAAKASVAAPSVSWTGTPAIDVAAGVVDQLHTEGVGVRWLPGCSRESDDLYSHRRDGTTGRYAGVVRLLPPEDVA
jgi:polyphenol oxidase